MPRFDDWTLKDAQEAVAAAWADLIDDDGYQANRLFVEQKDHWQDGNGWIGPTGPQGYRERTLARIKPQFTPADAVGEVLGRFVNALVKTEADVGFRALEPAGPEGEESEQQQQEADDMLAAVSRWWDAVTLWEHTRAALRRTRWGGRGSLRVYVPTAMLTTTTDGARALPSGLPFADALARLRLAAEEPKTCAVVVEPDTLERVAVFLFEQDKQAAAEVWVVRDGVVHLRVLTAAAGTAYQFPVPALPIAEMAGEILITEPVRRQQKRLNFFESILTRLGETAAFPERYTGNAQKEGEWTTVAPTDGIAELETREIDGTTWYKVPRARTLGASILTELVGLPIQDDAGNIVGMTTPTITKFDPTDPEFAIKAAQHARASVLKDCHQAHVLGAENLQRSGISIVQARADFADDLTNAKGPLEALLRDIITAAIAWAGAMSSEFPGFLSRYRVVVNVRPNPGPLTVEERTQNAADVAAGLLSDETAMAMSGIEDVDAERARIAASPMGSLALAEKQAAVFKAWDDAGAPMAFAAKMAGLSVEDAAALVVTGPPAVAQ